MAMFQEQDMDGHKLFEIVGEALPQFILGLVYIINDWDHVFKHDRLFESQKVPTSVWSIIFSFGSLMIGLTKAGIYWKNVDKNNQPALEKKHNLLNSKKTFSRPQTWH